MAKATVSVSIAFASVCELTSAAYYTTVVNLSHFYMKYTTVQNTVKIVILQNI